LLRKLSRVKRAGVRGHAALMRPRVTLSAEEQARVFATAAAFLGHAGRIVRTCAPPAVHNRSAANSHTCPGVRRP